MQSDFNFTLGSRWQSRRAGVAVVTQLDPGTTLPVALRYENVRKIWLYANGREHGPGFLTSRYDITGPADPQPPAPSTEQQGDDEQAFWDAAAVAALQGILSSPKTEFRQVYAEDVDLIGKMATALLAARRLRMTDQRDTGRVGE